VSSQYGREGGGGRLSEAHLLTEQRGLGGGRAEGAEVVGVARRCVADRARARGVLHRLERLLHMHVSGRRRREHHRERVTPERVLPRPAAA